MLLRDHASHARSVVVVGASANRAKWANMLFRRLIDRPYRGRLAAVNPARSEIEGVACYPSVAQLPFVPDYVQVVVRRANVARTLRDFCAGLNGSSDEPRVAVVAGMGDGHID